MAIDVLRLGDTGLHAGVDPGTITSASANVNAVAVAVAYHGCVYECTVHGTQTVVGSGANLVNGQPVARHGDVSSCGAVISASQSTVKSD